MIDRPTLPDTIRATLPPVVQAYLTALEQALETTVAALSTLSGEVATLQGRVASLEARLGQNSTNSSRPPSSDPPGRRPAPPSAHGARRPGGQPGHQGTFRALLPVEVVDRVERLTPPACAHCGHVLAAEAGADDPAAVRQQVLEVPAVTATVTEYQLAARRCALCGQLTRAAIPAAVGTGGFGPRLRAVLTLLTGRYRLSKREAVQCVADVFGVTLALGSVSGVEQMMSAALAPIVAEAAQAVQQAPVANLDETSWRQGRQRAWLWTVVTAAVTVFRIDRHRSGQVARELLGPDWTGVVGSDRYTAYQWLPVEQRQVCWAHLKRDFQRLVDWGPGPRPVGLRLLAITAQVFELWHRFKAGDMDRTALHAAMGRVAAEMAAVLADGAHRGHPVVQPLCRQLQVLWPALWTFLGVAGVEPTNNAAEHALRPAVLWRKGSFGTHSVEGSRFVERMLTVTATCRQQGRQVLSFLVEAITAAQCGQPYPSLLPAATT
jgi:transposase